MLTDYLTQEEKKILIHTYYSDFIRPNELKSKLDLLLEDLSLCEIKRPLGNREKLRHPDENRNIVPYFFKKIYFDYKDSFSHLCASPRKKDIFHKAYAFPDLGTQMMDEPTEYKLRAYKKDSSKLLSPVNF